MYFHKLMFLHSNDYLALDEPFVHEPQGVVDLFQRENAGIDRRRNVMLLDDLRNPAQLLTVGMHEEEAILFALTAGCPVSGMAAATSNAYPAGIFATAVSATTTYSAKAPIRPSGNRV